MIGRKDISNEEERELAEGRNLRKRIKYRFKKVSKKCAWFYYGVIGRTFVTFLNNFTDIIYFLAVPIYNS